MASEDKVIGLHQNTAIITAAGAFGSMFSMSTYFLSYEYKDFYRANLGGNENFTSMFERRKKWAHILSVISVIVFLFSLTTIVLGISLYRDEREKQADDIPSLIQQIRNLSSQPEENEPAMLAGISTAIIFLGILQCLRHFHKTEKFGWVGSLLYAMGWMGNAFAAGMQDRSISSLNEKRLAWTIPGSVGIVAGTFLLPWQIRHQYVTGIAWPLISAGYLMFGIGNSLVTGVPEYVV